MTRTENAMPAAELPTLPRPLAIALRPLPLLPLSMALGALARRMTQSHPSMLRRLGDHARRRFLIDPVDLPFVLLLVPSRASVTALRRGEATAHDARLAGPLSAFLAMLHGAEDGDALFFSRDLTIEGDTAAVLALRNAVDDAELDLSAELAGAGGRFGVLIRHALVGTERVTGLALHRMDDHGEQR